MKVLDDNDMLFASLANVNLWLGDPKNYTREPQYYPSIAHG